MKRVLVKFIHGAFDIIMEDNRNYNVKDNRIFRIGDMNDVISTDVLK